MPQKRYTLITGATSGIGLALAEEFASHGFNIILSGRNERQLEELSAQITTNFQVSTDYIAADLSKQGNAERLYQEVKKRGYELNVLINNAGFGWKGKFEESDLQNQLDMIQVNVSALTELSRLVITEMVEHREGRILNVASTASFLPGPLMSTYYATKAYVRSFSIALNKEVEHMESLAVCCLCPGATLTAFDQRANLSNSKLFRLTPKMTAKQVAAAGYKGTVEGKEVIVPGFNNKLTAIFGTYFPTFITARIAKSLHQED
jgi:uncharacterized protein